MFNSIHEECGVFGIYDPSKKRNAAHITYTALYALQHRGQESSGMAVVDPGGHIYSHKAPGLVNEVFSSMDLNLLETDIALGHVRYAAASNKGAENIQPYIGRNAKGQVAFAHNGSLVNAEKLRDELIAKGALMHSTSDAEIIAYAVAAENLREESFPAAMMKAMDTLEGAYSVVAITPDKMYAMRDPNGFRPLCMGKIGEAIVFASESCAIDSIGGEFIRDIRPGEIVEVGADGIKSYTDKCGSCHSLCVFEHIYFARPDSVIDGESVHLARQLVGECLAEENPIEADIVVGVPDSGLDAAIGYARKSGIPYGIGLVKNRYIGRTFIQTSQRQRENSVRIKLNPIASVLKDKRVVLVDDSIVRGTTCANLIWLIREAGAKEVHFLSSCPPFRFPCYYGTDIDSKEKLIANRMTKDEICKAINADSLGFLSIEALGKLRGKSNLSFCDACFTGNYPVPPKED